ncbi:hypothetical protein SCMU_11050 [Sinomonas cyclohexanicum]|uniref:Reverse transcriptase domain-containing protein n=1 Tax=Sinomonas cyclohexanicum TaxID=322009 RepID=A0ABM7PSP8_SINCY|nr:reverse transcriptase domain-containing protein [Corynebacterium cyclohexanicum]BCT75263.1 hypothetical protein SCMU_11050 [Corynebacterium cyclohexanicum]
MRPELTVEVLEAECRRLIQKHERYCRELRSEDVRRNRRSTTKSLGTIRRPDYWSADDGFNPYVVRSRAKTIVRAVNLAIRKDDYHPKPPIAHRIPKADGEFRTVSVFQIADTLISREVYASLLQKNRALMSSRSYAYRGDLSTHDAIQYICGEFSTSERIFVAEYDFKKFFDSISHDHIWRVLDSHPFLVSVHEKRILESLLAAPLQPTGRYESQAQIDPSKPRRGLPQGTAASLFLANAAAFDLDRALERLGVGFARYADDTLIWSRDYSQICEAVNALKNSSEQMGSALNPKKSPGIRLFVPSGERSEIQSTESINFVGYRFSRGKVGLRDGVIARMKNRVQDLIWMNLLRDARAGTLRDVRVAPSVDRDYVVLIMQLRRYLYGNLTEDRVRELERGEVKRVRFPGIMSYFPLADDQEQLKAFDGWLASTVHRALSKRAVYIRSGGVMCLPNPHGLTRSELLSAEGRTSDGERIDLRLPSITRFAGVMNRAAKEFGPNSIGRGAGTEEYQYAFERNVR